MKRFSRFFTFLLAFILCMSIGIATTLADDGSYTVFVGGVELTIGAGNTVAYATNDAMGAVTTVGADADHYTIRFELVEGVPTVTLTDATVQNAGGNGIEAVAGDLTVVGVDTPANGENAVSGGKNGIFARGAITIKGAMGDITGGTDGGIYSTQGNITIAEGAVLGDLHSEWYTLQTDNGNITINGKVGDVTGVIGITSEYNHDVIIAGQVGKIQGTDYGVFAYKNFSVAPSGRVGDVSGNSGGIMAIANVAIEGTVGNISGTHGIYAMEKVEISGTLGDITGQCAIRSINSDVEISGATGAIRGNGGAGNTGSSYGIRADAGKVVIKKAVGPITADSEGQGVSVVAIRAQTGIELADNLGIKVPEQNKIDVYGDTYYTVFDLAPAQGTEAAVVADRVELVNVYTVTYRADGKIVATVRVEHGMDAAPPEVPAKEGYTGAWDGDGKAIIADTVINAVYTLIPAEDTPDSVDPEIPPTGDGAQPGLLIGLLLASAGCILGGIFCGKKGRKAEEN